MNQGCKFTDRERLRVPRPAPSLCVRQQLFGLAARWAVRAVLVTAPKVGMQGFLQLLTWIQSLFSSDQQCSRPSTHFHSSKLHSDTRRGLKPVNSSLNLPPCQALLPEIPRVGFRECAGTADHGGIRSCHWRNRSSSTSQKHPDLSTLSL